MSMQQVKDSSMLEANQVRDLLRVLSMGQAVFERLDALSKTCGMTVAQASILTAVQQADGEITVSMLAKQLYRQSHTVTELVDALQRAGLVDRKRDHLDRRKVWILLTPLGKQRVASYLESANHAFATLGGGGRSFENGLQDAERRLGALLGKD
jgi:DNA-binding MarR family transcriptional regulator